MKTILMKPLGKIRQLLSSGRQQENHEATPANVDQREAQKIAYGKAVLANGVLPTNFSIIIGAAPCNHTCLFCPQSIEKPKKAIWLDLGLLEKVLNEMPEENILLNVASYSETLAAPSLVPSLRLMKKIRPKLAIAMASNGSLFKESVLQQIIDESLVDHYSFSFDAATKQDYATLMQADHYEKTWGHLERLVEMRNQAKSSMKVTTHIMGFKGKEADFEEFKKRWDGKVDAVVWRRVSNWGSDDLGLEAQLAREGFVSAHETPSRRFPCPSIFMHFKLNPEGQYFPCVAAVPAYGKNLIDPIGNASEMTWMEAWEKLSAMRQAHLAGKWDDYECCRTCNVWSMWDDMWFEEVLPDGTSRFFLKDTVHVS